MSNKRNNREKSDTALRTIGEVSAELNILPHVLRFWEGKFSQIKPQKRRGGHRYYRPQDVETVKEIKELLYDKGFTIKGAQNYLKEKKKNDNNIVDFSENKLANADKTTSKNVASSNPDNLKSILDDLLELKKLAASKIA